MIARIVVLSSAILLGLITLVVQQSLSSEDPKKAVKCLSNKYDSIIAEKFKVNGLSQSIVDSNGRFRNPWTSWREQSFFNSIRFFLLEKDHSNVPKNQDELDKELPILKPDFGVASDLQKDTFRVTWIGHATLLIQVDGINILADPVFSERANVLFSFGYKRIRRPACTIKELPPIHIVLITHDHPDHLDLNSVKEVYERFGDECKWIVPLGIGKYLSSMSISNYVELDWWSKDCYDLPSTGLDDSNYSSSFNEKVSSRTLQNNTTRALNRMGLDIYFTPTQHWSRRGFFDVDQTLWGSFVIVNREGSRFFLGGDTGYCPVFKEIGDVFGPFAGAALPIGAYNPRWFMKNSHVNVTEAVEIHRDLKSVKSIAIHHATFILSYEPYKEPATWLNQTMTNLKANDGVNEPFVAVKHGETVQFCKNC